MFQSVYNPCTITLRGIINILIFVLNIVCLKKNLVGRPCHLHRFTANETLSFNNHGEKTSSHHPPKNSTLSETNSKSTWKWMVGILVLFPFGAWEGLFSGGKVAVSFRECKPSNFSPPHISPHLRLDSTIPEIRKRKHANHLKDGIKPVVNNGINYPSKIWMGPYQPTPSVSCDSSLLDTQVFSGSVKRGSCGFDFLETTTLNWLHTVDGWNPANQLRLVVFPIIYRVSAPSQVVVWDFSHQQ